MSCEWWREGISALVDGEDPGYDQALLDAHLSRCPVCRRYRDELEAENRRRRVQSAAAIPDLSRSVARRVASDDRAGHPLVLRLILAVLGIIVIANNVPELVSDHGSPHTAHELRHLAAFSAAYGVGLLVVVVRPARARTMLSVGMVVAGTLAITAVVDIADGEVPFGGELVHLVEVASVVVLWTLTVPPSGRPLSRRQRASTGPQTARQVGDRLDDLGGVT